MYALCYILINQICVMWRVIPEAAFLPVSNGMTFQTAQMGSNMLMHPLVWLVLSQPMNTNMKLFEFQTILSTSRTFTHLHNHTCVYYGLPNIYFSYMFYLLEWYEQILWWSECTVWESAEPAADRIKKIYIYNIYILYI